MIFKGLKISHVKKHTRWWLYTCDCVDVVLVLLFHWWSMTFPFCVLDLDVESVEFGWGMSSKKFVINRGCLSLVCRLSSSCFAWSKERSDYIETFVMLKMIKNWAIWYGAKVPSTILQNMPIAVYADISFSISPYKIFMTSMMSFVWPRMRWTEWKLIWKYWGK